MPRNNLGKLLLVEWTDSGGSANGSGWKSADDLAGWLDACNDMRSVGWLIAEDNDWLVLAGTRGLDGLNYNGGVKIARGCVRKLVVLKEAK